MASSAPRLEKIDPKRMGTTGPGSRSASTTRSWARTADSSQAGSAMLRSRPSPSKSVTSTSLATAATEPDTTACSPRRGSTPSTGGSDVLRPLSAMA